MICPSITHAFLVFVCLHLSNCPLIHLSSFSVHLSVCASIHPPSIHSCIYPPIHPSIHPFIHASSHPSVCASIHPSIHPSDHPCLFRHPAFGYIHLSVCQSQRIRIGRLRGSMLYADLHAHRHNYNFSVLMISHNSKP